MPDYAILRVKKIKTISSMKSALNHNSRTKKTLNVNANESKKNKNYVDEYMGNIDYFKSILPEKRRKDAVLGIEVMATTSHDFWVKKKITDLDFWVEDNLQWMKDKFGESNILRFDLHMDETTPHIHAVIIPLADGKLNAKKFLGGPKEMRAMQDSYYQKMAIDVVDKTKKRDLSRGIKGSKAKHTTIRQYYSALNKLIPDIPQKNGLLDFNYKKRLEQWNNKVLGTAKMTEILHRNNSELNKSNAVLRKTSQNAIKGKNIESKNLRTIVDSLWEINNSKYKDKASMVRAIIKASENVKMRKSKEKYKKKSTGMDL